MARTFYAQSDPAPTMSVGQLAERLAAIANQDLPVVFRTPLYGAFGSHTAYTIDDISEVHLPERTDHHPAGEHFDEETGETSPTEPWTETWSAWTGVVIA